MIDVGTQRVYIELSTEPCLKITGTIKSAYMDYKCYIQSKKTLKTVISIALSFLRRNSGNSNR